MNRRRSFQRPLAAGALLACSADRVALPSPPAAEETDQILAEYEAPSGTFDRDALPQMVERVRERLGALGIAHLPELVLDALTRLGQRFEASGLPADPAQPADDDRAQIHAVIELSRVCRGWSEGSGSPDEGQNGAVRLTAIVDDTRLYPRLWGTLTRCRESLAALDGAGSDPPRAFFLDGTFVIHLYGALPTRAAEADFWFGFAGALESGSSVRSISFDLRFLDRRLEFRHPVDDGSVIVGVSLSQLTLRGADATYVCDLPTRSCELLER